MTTSARTRIEGDKTETDGQNLTVRQAETPESHVYGNIQYASTVQTLSTNANGALFAEHKFAAKFDGQN